jgi:hypothetical protein
MHRPVPAPGTKSQRTLSNTYIRTIARSGETEKKITAGMSVHYRTPDFIQRKVLATLPWEGGRKTEAVVRYTFLDGDAMRSALEDLIRRGMVTIDDRSYWRKKPVD